MVETDDEQLDKLKGWWYENGRMLMIVVVLAVGGTLGYRAWENNSQEAGEAASAIYENLLTALDNAEGDEAMATTAMSLGAELKADYDNSTYAVYGALHLAKVAVNAGDIPKARSELEWALRRVDEPHLETITISRLARVLLEADAADAAMALLAEHQPAAGLESSFAETQGDVLLALGDLEDARRAYQKALEAAGDENPRPVLEIKLADIPLPPGEAAAENAGEATDEQPAGETDARTGEATDEQPAGETDARTGEATDEQPAAETDARTGEATDEQPAGETDAQTGEATDEQPAGETDARTGEATDEQPAGETDARTGEATDEQPAGETDARTGEATDEQPAGETDARTGEATDEQPAGETDARTGEATDEQPAGETDARTGEVTDEQPAAETDAQTGDARAMDNEP